MKPFESVFFYHGTQWTKSENEVWFKTLLLLSWPNRPVRTGLYVIVLALTPGFSLWVHRRRGRKRNVWLLRHRNWTQWVRNGWHQLNNSVDFRLPMLWRWQPAVRPLEHWRKGGIGGGKHDLHFIENLLYPRLAHTWSHSVVRSIAHNLTWSPPSFLRPMDLFIQPFSASDRPANSQPLNVGLIYLPPLEKFVYHITYKHTFLSESAELPIVDPRPNQDLCKRSTLVSIRQQHNLQRFKCILFSRIDQLGRRSVVHSAAISTLYFSRLTNSRS